MIRFESKFFFLLKEKKQLLKKEWQVLRPIKWKHQPCERGFGLIVGFGCVCVGRLVGKKGGDFCDDDA